MLELPEVEVLRKDLEKEVVGKRIKDVTVKTAGIVKPFHRTRPEFAKALEGRKIEAVRRRGIILFIDLDEDHTWIVDMGSTASMHRETANEAPRAETHLAVTFTIGGAIHLSDPGDGDGIQTGVVPTEEAYEQAGVDPTAFDPFSDQVTWMDFGRKLEEAKTTLRTFLTDPKHVVGIRDVYADEILYESGLRFDHTSVGMSAQEIRRFYRAIQEVIHAAIKFRGSSLDDIEGTVAVDADGDASTHLKVYGREGLPSPRSRQPIVRERVKKGIYTFYDPQSQI